MALAAEHSRNGILEALKQRHCYAATDAIVMDVRSGSHLQGDEFKTSAAPALQIKLIGAAPLALVVEDNVEMNAFIAETLGRDYRVVTAYDGREGLSKALETMPDLIVSDVMMPTLGGDEMVRELRAAATPDLAMLVVASRQLRQTLG